MHSEWTDLVPLSSAPGQTGDLTDSDGMQFGYETKLIPLYWFNLCQNAGKSILSISTYIYLKSSANRP